MGCAEGMGYLSTAVQANLDCGQAYSTSGGVDEDAVASSEMASHDDGIIGCHVGCGHSCSLCQAPVFRHLPCQVAACHDLGGHCILCRSHDPLACGFLNRMTALAHPADESYMRSDTIAARMIITYEVFADKVEQLSRLVDKESSLALCTVTSLSAMRFQSLEQHFIDVKASLGHMLKAHKSLKASSSLAGRMLMYAISAS